MGFRRARGLVALLFFFFLKSLPPAQHGRVSSSSLVWSAPSPSPHISVGISYKLLRNTCCFIPCSRSSQIDLSALNCTTSARLISVIVHTHPHGVLAHSVPNQIIHNNPIPFTGPRTCHDLACLQPPPCRENSSSKTNPLSKAPTSLPYPPPLSKLQPADDPPSQIISLRLLYLPTSWRWVVVPTSSLLLLLVPVLLGPSVRWRTLTCLRRLPARGRLSR